MHLKDESVRRVSRDIAEKVIGRVKPEALQRYGMERITRHALPRSLDEVYLGPVDDALEIASHILQSVVHAIRTRGEAIDKATELKDIEAIVLEGISTRMSELGREAETGQIRKGLEATFVEHPSLLDRITGAVIPPFETEEDQLLKIEQDLRKCVLKVTCGNWQGTAFAIGPQGYIVSAYHILSEREREPTTLIYDGAEEVVTGEATVIDTNSQSDIAILELDEETKNAFSGAGLRPCSFVDRKAEDTRGHHVLGLGYHAQSLQGGKASFVDPSPMTAQVVRHYPIRKVEFKGAGTQPCLILLITERDEPNRLGMSGGPILDLETGEVIAMITGAQAVRIHQPYTKKSEDLPIAEYAFGVFLSDVANSWPEFEKYCRITRTS